MNAVRVQNLGKNAIHVELTGASSANNAIRVEQLGQDSVTIEALGSNAVRVVMTGSEVVPIQLNNKGPRGEPGDASVLEPLEFTQGSPSSNWVINHNLGRIPEVTVVSPGGVEVEAGVVHTSNNQAVVQFASPYSGRAYVR